MAKVDLYEFDDLLRCAERIGYGWNNAHNILMEDQIPPMYELRKMEYHKSEFDDESADEYSLDTQRIMLAFFKQENLSEFTLV